MIQAGYWMRHGRELGIYHANGKNKRTSQNFFGKIKAFCDFFPNGSDGCLTVI